MANFSTEFTANLDLQCDPNAPTPQFPYFSALIYGDGPLGFNQLGACSGNGQCLLHSSGLFKCQCNDGWTGLSDLINTEGIDCQINNLAVKIEWGFVVALLLLMQFLTLDHVRDRVNQHFELKKTRAAQGKKYTIWRNNRTLLAMIFYNLGCFPSMLILGILRMADDGERAGVTYGYSILFFTGKVSFYLAALIYQPALLASLLSGGQKDKKKAAALINLGFITQYVTFTISVLAALAPFPILADPDKGVTEFAQWVYIIYFALQVASMVILFVVSFIIKVRANALFEQSYSVSKDERTKTLQGKIDSLEKKALISSSIIGTVYLVYTIFPLLYNRHDYVFPLTWLPFVILGREINKQHIKDKHTSSSKEPNSKSDGESGATRRFGSKVTGLFSKGSKNPKYGQNAVEDDNSKELEPASVTNFVSEDDDGYV